MAAFPSAPNIPAETPDETIARLTAELREALDQQAATSEILEIINRSGGDLAPVFDAMLEKATGLCDAAYGNLWTYDGERFHNVAMHGNPRFAELLRQHGPVPPAPGNVFERIMQGECLLHIADAANDDAQVTSSWSRAVVEISGARTTLVVPLRKDDALLGAIFAYRQEVRPFSEKQIALFKNFAAQAVIAMENARLLTETREALEQQTATAEVLQVINSSPGDLAPVFDAMLEKATRLCEAAFGLLRTWDGERFHLAAVRGGPKFTEWAWDYGPFAPDDGSPLGRIVSGERVVQFADAPGEEAHSIFPGFRALVDASGMRSGVTVALRKNDILLGTVTVYRQELRPFTDKQIALLQNFAAQAVIAMENARLITETHEALDQQTATAEVLQVINSSPGELVPVFDAMLERAMRLCEAAHGHFLTYDGEVFRQVAIRGEPRFAEYWRQQPPFRPAGTHPLAQLVCGERVVHRHDAREDDAYRDVPEYRRIIDLGGIRTSLMVPLRKEGTLLGAIRMYRQEVRPFSEKQIALVENFAAQAVIAMENARLITETREALEQQTATAEVLQVINSSPGDLSPVFDAILEKAHNLCGVTIGALEIWDGERLRALATRGLNAQFEELIRQGYKPDPNDAHWQLVNGAGFVHIPDQAAVDDPMHRRAAEVTGVRTFLGVALRKDATLLGRIVAGRPKVRPFTDKQIALLQNFAAQAVIAMENARLITETREALGRQTATAEVLQVINSSPGDLAPVFDAMLDKAMALCEGSCATLYTLEGEHARTVAVRGASGVPEWMQQQDAFDPPPGSSIDRLRRGERFVHLLDATETEAYRASPCTGT